ncbi:MAG: hypothetical protein JXB04_05835 [Kiritimatiellae bacterium]|nr:hypothetical protein [Kiritimatiellia bacterium]
MTMKALMEERTWMVMLSTVAVALWIILGAANLYLGDLNQDEGWYLYAARQVAQGYVPYRDFAFTQGPVMAYGYAAAYPLVRAWGVAGGRLVTMGFALFTLAAGAWLASRLVPAKQRGAAAALSLGLIGVNVYQSYFTTVVKTYALSGFLLVAGLLALSFATHRGRSWACLLAGLLLTAATATRISAGIVLPVVFVYLVLQRKTLAWSACVSFALGSVLGFAALLLPFYLLAPEGFVFGMAGYHALRLSGRLMSLFVYKAGFISRMAQAYLVAVCLWAALVIMHVIKPFGRLEFSRETSGPPRLPALLWAAVLGITLVHGAAPFPYDDYQVMVYPVFAAVLASALMRHFAALRVAAAIKGEQAPPGTAHAVWLVSAVVVVSAVASFSSPINQDWFSRGRDRIWWLIKEEPALRKLQRVAAILGEATNPHEEILTQDAYLAVEADRPLPAGMEMGPFSYFPDWPRERAETLCVLNREMMAELLSRTSAPVAALSGYSLAIRAPEIKPLPEEEQQILWDILLSRYEEIGRVVHFGQAHTTLRILTLRPETEAGHP